MSNNTNPSERDSGYADELDQFVNEVAEDTVEEIGVKRRARFRLWIALFLIVGAIFIAIGLTYDPDDIDEEDDSNPAPAAVAESQDWLEDARETANAYRTQLTSEEVDCSVVRDEEIYNVPDLPDEVESSRETPDERSEAYGLMIGIHDDLLEAQDKITNVCSNSQNGFSNDNWPPNTNPLPLQIEPALTKIDDADAALSEVGE